MSDSHRCREFDERLRAFAWSDRGMSAWVEEQGGAEPCIAEGLSASRERGDWDAFERYVLAADIHPSHSYTEALCAVLDERRDDVNNEALADAINHIGDPASVPCLGRAVSFVPEWDDDGQLARKAVWALDRIGTPEALHAIREGVTPELPFKVVEAAEEALARPR